MIINMGFNSKIKGDNQVQGQVQDELLEPFSDIVLMITFKQDINVQHNKLLAH